MSFLGADFFGDDASFDAAVAAPAPFHRGHRAERSL